MPEQDKSTESEKKDSQSSYTPPQSQEEFDRIIQERVARAKQSAADEVRKSYEGFVSKDEFDGLKQKYEKANNELGLEYRKAATREAGLPESMADRLQGESRDDWMNDARSLAESLAGVMSPAKESSAGKSDDGDKSGESDERGEGASEKAQLKSRPAEQRGQAGGRPGEQDDFSVDEVLKKIQRI